MHKIDLRSQILQIQNDILYSAVECGNPISKILSGKQQFQSGSSPNPTTFLKVVEIMCQIGYQWIGGVSIRNISCTYTANWTILPTCQGVF